MTAGLEAHDLTFRSASEDDKVGLDFNGLTLAQRDESKLN